MPTSEKALSASLMLTTGGLTGRLDRIERAGLVTRSPDPADRRGLVITGRGREVIDEAVVMGLDAQREVLERLPEASHKRLSALLRDLLAAAEA
ncbi:MarR family winged helix-turn-helix transcriptional regulator [Dactylosporangium sp. CA-139114]|uniref:MarR family winged helix-turn-helix transcriptional regulator n=1 Tax=Dactylosporangium sp. CA-139114 TaxID=3239931 RepID=UPI003D95276A